ncbi:Nup93/Nic96-domain-containing protein [Halteromyces radiatus]|uniref:Nup93/Nic96-domain-containing protein n=1 Tax=Halteromyces radiatus TaxID=101107 RepID=UPI00221F42EE|nr:Nup93/Nic96-domain-containing protein [Halteromyces radiatus]KAI8089516.1 Nup93/Nic96-domain-containing protein [Halteromyces radiatus]
MSSFIFEKLYEKSKQLVQPTSSSLHQLPYIDRELDQIGAETQLLADKTKAHSQDPYIKAHCLLAQGGVNQYEISEVLKKLDTSSTFERRERSLGANVDKYLEQSYEQAMKEAFKNEELIMEELGIQGNLVKVDTDWNTKAQTCLNEWDQQAPILNISDSLKSNISNKDKDIKGTYNEKELERENNHLLDLAQAIQQLNDHRLQEREKQGKKFDLIAALPSSLLPSSSTSLSKGINTSNFSTTPTPPPSDAEDAQQLLRYFVTQFDKLKDDNLAWTLYDTPHNPKLLATQSCLISISKSWLEKQYIHYIDSTLWKHASKAKTGGNPSFVVRLQSFIQFTFKRGSRWIDDRFQIADGIPMWAYLYMLLRSGHPSLAIKYVNDHQQDFESAAPSFIKYFMEYMNHPEKTLQRSHSVAVLAEYEQMKYGNEIVDPYKLLLYKVIGRCEVDKTLPTIIRSSEDYLWLQLSLIRLPGTQEEYINERYTLQDLQDAINGFGSGHYDRNGNTPWPYFKILLSTLQFEKAISYLHQFEQTRFAAVHYAIVLGYYGLLCIPKDPLVSNSGIVTTEKLSQQVSFNFARFIREYIKSAYIDRKGTEDTRVEMEKAAIQYVFLLTMFNQEEMLKLSFLYIQDLVLCFPDGECILGTNSPGQGKRQLGLIDRYKRLLGVQDQTTYSTHILHPIGERLVKKGRYTEAIHVYQLSNDDNKVLDVLIKELGDTLFTVVKDINAAKANPDIRISPQKQQVSLVDMAQSALQHCDANLSSSGGSGFRAADDNKKQMIRAFILLFKGVWLYGEEKDEQALWAIQASGILPLVEKITLGQIQSMCDHFSRLEKQQADAIYNNLPGLIVISGDILYNIWFALTQIPDNRASMMPHIQQIKQQMRNLLLFIGLMPDKIPGDITERLNRIDINMTTSVEQRFV